MKRHLFLLIFLSAVAALAQMPAGLAGTWKAQEGPLTVVLTLNPDGSGSLDDAKIKYSVKGNTLSVIEDGQVNNYTFELKGNTLRLAGGDLDKPMLFQREGAAAKGTGLGARRQAAAGEAVGESSPAAPAATQNGPAGTWQVRTPNGLVTLVLNPDGTGTLNGERGRWELNNGILILKGETGPTVMFNAALTAATLTLSGGTLPQPLTLERQGAKPSAAVAAKPGNPLVGEWQGPRGLVRFTEDGTLSMQGQSYRYTISGNTVTLIAPDGSVPMPYTIQGDTLTLTGNSGSITLRRVAGSMAAGAGGTGGVRQELVGKWCYFGQVTALSGGGRMTDECFTLLPDGTYQYSYEASASAYAPGIAGGTATQRSDAGTWTATNTSITANSRTSGANTYSLEKRNHPKNNDPMLCLDGRCFVTYGPRPPW